MRSGHSVRDVYGVTLPERVTDPDVCEHTPQVMNNHQPRWCPIPKFSVTLFVDTGPIFSWVCDDELIKGPYVDPGHRVHSDDGGTD